MFLDTLFSAEEQLGKFANFLNDYDEKLWKIVININRLQPENVIHKSEWIVSTNDSTNKELPLSKMLEADILPQRRPNVVLTLGRLCQETFYLVSEASMIQSQFLYFDDDLCSVAEDIFQVNIGDKGYRNEPLLRQMSNSLKFLSKMQFLLERCIVLANYLFHQYTVSLSEYRKFKLRDVFDCISHVLQKIVVFDEVLSNSFCSRFWNIYKGIIDVISHENDIEEYVSEPDINGLRNWLNETDVLFSGSSFQFFLDDKFLLEDNIGTKGLNHMMQQFNEYIEVYLNMIKRFDFQDINDLQLVIRINVFYVVFCDLCGKVDPKYLKSLLEINVKYSAITIIGNMIWKPLSFLRKHLATKIKHFERILQDDKPLVENFLDVGMMTINRDYEIYCTKITLWSLQVHKIFKFVSYKLKPNQFKDFDRHLLQGLHYASEISCYIKTLVNSYALRKTPMSKNTLSVVCKLIELLKSIQRITQDNTESMSKINRCILQHLQHKIAQMLYACKRKLIGTSKYDCDIDAQGGIKIAEKCVNGPVTNTRRIILQLALSFENKLILSKEQRENFELFTKRMETFSKYQEYLKSSSDISFICWHQTVLSSYLKKVLEQRENINLFQYVTETMNSYIKDFSIGLDSSNALKSNSKCLRREIISKICAQVEKFLRLEVLSYKQLFNTDSFEQNINHSRQLLNVIPFELNGNYIILKDCVENHLSTIFYNLTTITLYNWNIYEEMRQISKSRFNISPIKDYLPNQTLEQGGDIVETVHNIHVFVAKYVYNMHTQMFVEQDGSNKHLDKMGIQHIANSLRTYGTGIMNTTVNFIYQFIRQKFYTFSHFLYDEQIKSRVMKELRILSERRKNFHYPLYTYERADAFNKDIRSLGLFSDGQSYMDSFRKIITHIGNAMGYIRLMRSGSIHANFNASSYLPKLEENLTFVNKTTQDVFSDVSINAAKNLETDINNLGRSFSASNDYFKILVDAFQPFFTSPHNTHLNKFYLIVPPLTLNYIEYMLNAKEKINKKGKQGPVFFDDGFTVGLAYILKLLDQFTDFNSLRWFEELGSHFHTEYCKTREMSTNALSSSTGTRINDNEKLKQTLALTERRINAYQNNYNLLFYNLCSAKILFL